MIGPPAPQVNAANAANGLTSKYDSATSEIPRGGSPEPPRELPRTGASPRYSCAAGQETRRANRFLALSYFA